MTVRCHLDIETYSRADLKKQGVYVYAEDPSTELLVVCYAFDDGPVTVWIPWYIAPNSPPRAPAWMDDLGLALKARLYPQDRVIIDSYVPADLAHHIRDGGEVWAHNAQFERTVLNGVSGARVGFPHLKIEQMRCTAAKARVHGLPGSLEDAANALDTHRKDDVGKGTMLQLCRPRKGEIERYAPKEHPDKYVQLFSYCADDVRAERGIDHAIPDLTPTEQKIWELDQRINDRGVGLDVEMIENVQFLVDTYKTQLEERCLAWTGYRPSQTGKLAEWVRANGYPQLEDLTADTVKNAVKDSECPEPVRKVLKLFSTYNMKAPTKYAAMIRAMCRDRRIRGMFLHYGAGTGRWSSLIVQLQNLFRPVIKDADIAIHEFRHRDLDWVRMLYPVDPMKVFASCVRGALIPAKSHDLMALDFRGIESRLTAWIFDETWKLNAFRAMDDKTGPDTYRLAYARLFQLPVDAVTSEQRQVGKVVELSMGFEGGVAAFVQMVPNYGVDLDLLAETTYPALPPEVLEQAYRAWEWACRQKRTADLTERVYVVCDALKRLWRAAHPAHVTGWANMKEASIRAVEAPGTAYALPNKKIMFKVVGQWLYMRLPSGRRIAYYKPHMYQPKEVVDENGNTFLPKPVLRYWGVDTKTRQWTRVGTYGGRLTQNFAEGIARDLLTHALFNLEAAGYPPVGSVHDEGLFEPASDWGSLEAAREIFLRPPVWAKGLPLDAEGFRAQRYRK